MFTSKALSSLENSRNTKATSSITLSVILIGALLLLDVSSAAAQDTIVPIGQVMDDCEISWYWDERNELVAKIDSQIILTNITDTHIEGKITSKNSNYTLAMYNDESIVKAQFGYNSGLEGDWYIAARPSNGMFSIEIPEEYSDTDYVKLWVNSNSFVMEPPSDAEFEDESDETLELQTENSTSTLMSSNSTTITTSITTTTSTNSTANSTIITTTTITTIEPVNSTDSTNSTNSTTTIITTVMTTTITPTDTITTTSTTTANSTSDEEEEVGEEEIYYLIGGNVTLGNINVQVLPSVEYWLADNVTMFFEEGYFMLDKRPILLYPYEDYEDFEENKKATHYEYYQTQIDVDVSSAMIKYDFKKLEDI
jgi:hypothetical protein